MNDKTNRQKKTNFKLELFIIIYFYFKLENKISYFVFELII